MWGWRRTHQYQRTVALQSGDVRVQIVCCGDGIDNQIEPSPVRFHVFGAAGYDNFIGAETYGVATLAGRGRENRYMSAHGMRQLHAHMSQAAQPHNSNP